MNQILSIENALGWSWGIVINQLLERLPDYRFLRMLRQPDSHVVTKCPKCEEKFEAKVPFVPVSKEIVDFFDLTVLQNCDAIRMVNGDKKKVIARIGGMFIDEKNPSTRYDYDLAQVGAVVATNKTLYEVGMRVNPNTHLITNGIDLSFFKPAEVKEKRMFTVGFAGNIWGMGLDYKGYQHFTQANIRMYGEVKVKQCLHAHSQIPHDKMPSDFYHKIDCLILPSRGEGCSNVVMEALACGVPVIITKVGFHGEMLEDGVNGLFIERDTDSIITAIRKLIYTEGLHEQMSKNSRAFAEKWHDINVVATRWDSIFKSMLMAQGKI